jgi:hypothetical protein
MLLCAATQEAHHGCSKYFSTKGAISTRLLVIGALDIEVDVFEIAKADLRISHSTIDCLVVKVTGGLLVSSLFPLHLIIAISFQFV